MNEPLVPWMLLEKYCKGRSCSLLFQHITIEASYLKGNGTSLFILLQGLVCIHRSSQIVHGISNWGTNFWSISFWCWHFFKMGLEVHLPRHRNLGPQLYWRWREKPACQREKKMQLYVITSSLKGFLVGSDQSPISQHTVVLVENETLNDNVCHHIFATKVWCLPLTNLWRYDDCWHYEKPWRRYGGWMLEELISKYGLILSWKTVISCCTFCSILVYMHVYISCGKTIYPYIYICISHKEHNAVKMNLVSVCLFCVSGCIM